ncbi:DUF748 domain-containing protein [Microbulbifer agarilyticus]|uniref:DUF748 domain-containing protein n=1 Tax=Microbulbifer agarilyticus TaxID=260552 RepID=UPI001CD2ACDB|nr:DUF748 domain-containing protein [Microbulbifer agarilyticus]MCA0902067.1 DUF748 domain-containing protein [Microbulbifer agarilyticus]
MSKPTSNSPPVSPTRQPAGRGIHRLLWTLVILLVVVAVLNLFVSILVPGMVQRWLQARGLEARIEYVNVSLPRLHAHLRNVEMRNESERGFRVREMSLGLSWWALLRGKIRVRQMDLHGGYMDLESHPGKIHGRVWEIGGWRLEEGPKRAKSWRLEWANATVHDSVVCYLHRPQWTSPTCFRIGKMSVKEFFVNAFREAQEPLNFDIGTDEMVLDNVLAWDERPGTVSQYSLGYQPPAEDAARRPSAEDDPIVALVHLQTRDVLFDRPGNHFTMADTQARKFAGCSPARWAEAVPALNRISGHCASARRLDLEERGQFSFGKQGEISWHQLSGEEVRLRYQNRQLPNWRAESIAINNFDYVRPDKTLAWQSGIAQRFSWCPSAWRNDTQHYCVTAGTLNLPQATRFAWSDGFGMDINDGVLSAGEIEDLVGKAPHPEPLKINELHIGALQYRNKTRRLGLNDTSLDLANGCLPGALWDTPDQCVNLSQLSIQEVFSMQFPRKVARNGWPVQAWALESGPFSLAHVQFEQRLQQVSTGSARPRLGDGAELMQLDWARLQITPDKKEVLADDFSLQSLSGCAPASLLPDRISPLCARLVALNGAGNFIFRADSTTDDAGKQGEGAQNDGGQRHGGADDMPASPYVILGEFSLDELVLDDHLAATTEQQTGLVLTQLRAGPGLFKRGNDLLEPGEYFALGEEFWWGSDDTAYTATELISSDDGSEKGVLQNEAAQSADSAAQASGETAAIGKHLRTSSTQLELDAIALESLQGCLPRSWQLLVAAENARDDTREDVKGGVPDGQGIPSCFDIRNLQQLQPLNLAFERRARMPQGDQPADSAFRFKLDAAALNLDHAIVSSASGESLLSLASLALPEAEIRLQSQPAMAHVTLPGASLAGAAFCLSSERCAELQALGTGDTFTLKYWGDRFFADLNQLALARFSLTGQSSDFTADIRDLSSLSMRVDLPPVAFARADWNFDALQASSINICWPDTADSERGLPQCLRSRDLSSRGDGITIGQLALYGNPSDPPQLDLAQLTIANVGFVQMGGRRSLALNLTDLRLNALRGCGPKDWLAASPLRSDNTAFWAGCLDWGVIALTGDNLISLAGGADASGGNERLRLGPLQANQLRLLPALNQKPSLELAYLQWRGLAWPGGGRLRVADLDAQGGAGCLPSGGSKGSRSKTCMRVGRLQVPGEQTLVMGEADVAFRSSGHITVSDFALNQGENRRVGFDYLDVDELVVAAGTLAVAEGEITGLSGCLPEMRFAEKSLAPCFDVGTIALHSGHRMQLSDFRNAQSMRNLRHVSVDGLRVTQSDFPGGLPAPLLMVESLQADLLGFGDGQLVSENLHLGQVNGCLPEGYVPGVRYCLELRDFNASGRFDFAHRELVLDMAQFHRLGINDTSGDRLLELEFAEARQVTYAKERTGVLSLEVANSKLFQRNPRAPEFVNYQWNTQIQHLSLARFEYLPAEKHLAIDSINLLRPRSILARGIEGDLGAWERFRDRTPEADRYKYRRGDLAREANRFRYRIREVYIDQGAFLWLDESEHYHAKLPIRHINVLLRGASNYYEDAAATLILRASPGGFSEMHVAGHINLRDNNHWDGGLLGYVEGAKLIPATPYMARLLGYKIQQGQLDALLTLSVLNNKLDALAKMGLEKIKVRRVEDTDHLEVKRSLIPLSFALALLKDGNGDVRIKMPVTGDLNDPDFNFQFVFSELLQRAILESLFAYFTPIGFYSLAKLAWDRFRAERFDDLLFAPGSDQLSSEAMSELNSMVSTLKDNPKARPGICGVATTQDLRVMFPHEAQALAVSGETVREFYRDPPRGMREELLELSKRRSRNVQLFLIEAGLSQRDFIQCAPDYIGTDSSAPRVELPN